MEKTKILKTELLHDLAIPLWGIYLKELKAGSQRDIYTPLLYSNIEFTIAKTWKQPKCPLTDEWISKMQYTHTMGYYSDLKRKEILTYATA